jgi:glutamine cyclotransferase
MNSYTGAAKKAIKESSRSRAKAYWKPASLLIPVVTVVLAVFSWAQWDGSVDPEELVPEILGQYAHDPEAYTQGLLWWDGFLYESTGRYGESSLRKVEFPTGRVIQRRNLPADLFGEGLERVEDQLLQLTWHENVVLVYRLSTFEEVKRIKYRGEGWGLCRLGEQLFMSNGSDMLTIRDSDTFLAIGELRVTLKGRAVGRLNELECAKGSIWANVWETDTIVRIDPDGGQVTATVDASSLAPVKSRDGEAVLNGVAYRPESDTFLITGKLWPKIFEVRFVKR